MALGSTQTSERNEYQKYILGGKNGRCGGLINLPRSFADFIEILGAPNSYSPEGLSRIIQGVTGGRDQTSGECSLC